MADDKPNKSNKPVNGKIPRHIEEALNTRDYLTSYEHLSSKEDFRHLEDKLAKLEAQRSTVNAGSQQYQDIVENIAFAENDLSNLDKAYHDRQNQHLANTIATYTKTRNVNERTTSLSGKQRFFNRARSSDDIYQPTEVIESNIQKGIAQVNQLGMELAGRVRGLGTEEMPESLREKAGQLTNMQEDIAFNKRLLKVQNRAGLSTEKILGNVDDVMSRTDRYFANEEIRDKVARGDVGSIQSETKNLGLRQRDVFLAQQQYDKAMEGGAKAGSEELKSFVKALKGATDALDKQQKVVQEMQRQGVGSGGGMSWGDVGMVAALAGRATAFTARSVRQIAVDNDIAEMGQKAKYASMANRIYGQADSAIMGGNMDALLELAGGSLNFAAKESGFNKTFTNVAEGTAQVGDAAEGLGNVATASIGGGKAGLGIGSAASATIAGGSQLAIELSKGAVGADMLRRGIIGGAKGIQSYDTALALQSQMRAMDSKMFQAVYNQGMTTYNSVAGLGGAGGIQSALMDTGTLGRMAGVGLTPEKAAQLTAGMRAAGAMGTGDALTMLRGAGSAKQRGILGQEEYIGMASQLMGAGGGASDLESIMAAAVAAGMDNSKSIGELVSGTLALSQGLTSMGVGATGSTQNMLAQASQNLIAAGVDPNLAANAAAMSIGNFSAAQSDKSFTLGNIMERSGIRRMGASFQNANTFQLNRLGELSMADHKVLLDAAKNPDNSEMQDRANQLLKGKGLSDILNPEGKGIKVGDVRELQKLSFTAAVMDKGALGVEGVDIGAIWDKGINKKEMSSKEMAIWAEFGPGTRGEAIFAGIRGDDPATQDPNSKAKLAGASAQETQAKFKLKELQDAEGKGPGKIEDVFTTLEKTLSGIQENIGPEKMSEEVQKAAEKFEAPTLRFEKSTEDFKKAVDLFVKHQNALMSRIGETGVKQTFESALKTQKDKAAKINPKTGKPQ